MAMLGFLESHALFVSSAMGASVAVIGLATRYRGENEQRPAGPQNIHHERTSRLGGAGVLIGYVAALVIATTWQLVPLFPPLLLLVAAIPAFVVGLCEDIAHNVSPRYRLLGALVSAAFASAFVQGIVPRVDVPYVDEWLAFIPFALPVTWLMVAGACNAFNIIDGSHGLAGGTGLLLFMGIAFIAWNAGDVLVVMQAAGMSGALLGFLVWNYPRGKIFLGDAGAYFVGFMYAELSIQLIARNPGISAWFAIALAAYPIVEMVFSIYRRKFVRHAPAMQPDLLHLHSLLYMCVLAFAQRPRPGDRRGGIWTRIYPGKERRRSIRRANAHVAPLLWVHAAICFANAVYFSANAIALVTFTCIYAIAYVLCYQSAVRIKELRISRPFDAWAKLGAPGTQHAGEQLEASLGVEGALAIAEAAKCPPMGERLHEASVMIMRERAGDRAPTMEEHPFTEQAVQQIGNQL